MGHACAHAAAPCSSTGPHCTWAMAVRMRLQARAAAPPLPLPPSPQPHRTTCPGLAAAPGAMRRAIELNEAAAQRRRGKMMLPAPQVGGVGVGVRLGLALGCWGCRAVRSQQRRPSKEGWWGAHSVPPGLPARLAHPPSHLPLLSHATSHPPNHPHPGPLAALPPSPSSWQVSDAELEQLARAGEHAVAMDADIAEGGSAATRQLLGDYATPARFATPMRTPARTPAGGGGANRVMQEAQNLLALQAGQTPLLGGDNPELHPSDFSGVTPRAAPAATPNPLAAAVAAVGATPGRSVAGVGATPALGGALPPTGARAVAGIAATPLLVGATPGRGSGGGLPSAAPTPMRDALGLNDPDSLAAAASKREEAARLALQRNELRAGLAQLPAPKNEYQIVVPELPGEPGLPGLPHLWVLHGCAPWAAAGGRCRAAERGCSAWLRRMAAGPDRTRRPQLPPAPAPSPCPPLPTLPRPSACRG